MQESFYKKILVAVDGSKYSTKALKHAIDLTKKYDASLSLIHVVDNSWTIVFVNKKDYLNDLRNYGNRSLKNADKLAVKNGVKTKQIIKEGKVGEEILKFARKEKQDLIVVGSKGLGSADRFFLGSVSTRLTNGSECPVLVVK